MEAAVALALCRWLLAVAGIVIGLLAYYRASLRVDIPNTLMQENAKLKGDLKALTVSVEQMLGAFEDRMQQAQKRAAAYASHESRRANSAGASAGGNGDGEGAVDVEPVDGAVISGIADLSRMDPHSARAMIRNARVMADRSGR